jgi:hypothetical protein
MTVHQAHVIMSTANHARCRPPHMHVNKLQMYGWVQLRTCGWVQARQESPVHHRGGGVT